MWTKRTTTRGGLTVRQKEDLYCWCYISFNNKKKTASLSPHTCTQPHQLTQSHDAIMRVEQGCVSGKIGRAS